MYQFNLCEYMIKVDLLPKNSLLDSVHNFYQVRDVSFLNKKLPISKRLKDILIKRAFDKEIFFYLWEGKEDAFVIIRKDKKYGFGIDDIIGLRHRKISFALSEEIENLIYDKIDNQEQDMFLCA